MKFTLMLGAWSAEPGQLKEGHVERGDEGFLQGLLFDVLYDFTTRVFRSTTFK